MSERRHRSRAAAERLARRLEEPRALRLALRLRAARAPARAQERADRHPDPATPLPISIWQPRDAVEGLVFERPAPGPFGDHYATRPTLPARKTGRRICFFGESAAAGYLYAPALTPAMILEQQLRALDGDADFEVFDLARTDETLHTLVETVDRSLQVDPDLFVIFAGNNWNLLETPEASAYFPSAGARAAYARRVRRAGFAGTVDDAGRAHLEKGSAALDRIAALAAERSIPVVVVVPEINLADWETLQPCTWLPADGVGRWYRHLAAARRLIAAGRFDEAVDEAQTMLDLDGGLCPTPYRLRAQAWEGAGRLARAADACRIEVAAASYATLCFLGAPQATPAVQELLRRSATRHGFATVDLPRIFARHTGSPLPGRRLFLDYCHLTIEGMKVAMAATAAAIVRLTSSRELALEDLVREQPDPEIGSHADATTKLGAAIHCAHRLMPVGPKEPILDHWCREALAADSGIAETMLDLIAVRAAPLPAVLTDAQIRNVRSPFRLGFQHGWRYDFLDADLLDALVRSLEDLGRDGAAQLERSLLGGSDRGRDPVDLISRNQMLEPLARVFPEVIGDDGPRCGYHRSPWPRSRFWFASEGQSGVQLELRARLPASSLAADTQSRTATVEINGRRVGTCELTTHWQARTLRIEARHLRRGRNDVSVSWPMPAQPGEQTLEGVLQRLEVGRQGDLHPIFGEIFSLRIAGSS